MATAPDISKLSYADLQKLIASASEAIADKRDEELKVLADGYAKKCAAAGFTPQESIDALKPYLPAAKGRKTYKKSTGPKPVAGTTYKHPKTGEKWTRPASGKGRTIGWLQELVDGGGTFEQYAVK